MVASAARTCPRQAQIAGPVEQREEFNDGPLALRDR